MSITGSNNPFACEPVVFANANSIVSLGTITRDGNQFTFSVGFVWKINGVTYQNNAPVVLTIAEASEGFQRIDNALLNTSNTIELQQGLESDTIALRPTFPDNNILLTSWNISGDAIGDTETPIVGTQFKQKNENQKFTQVLGGTNAVIDLQTFGQQYYVVIGPVTSIAGFSKSLLTATPTAEVPYGGKDFYFENKTDHNVTLKNAFSPVDIPFNLGADLIVPTNGIVWLKYNPNTEQMDLFFKSWTDLSHKADLVGGKVPAEQLPSYVDDVIEGYFNGTSFYTDALFTNLITAESNKIYINIAVTPATQYRWSGSGYAQIGGGGNPFIQESLATTGTNTLDFDINSFDKITQTGSIDFEGINTSGTKKIEKTFLIQGSNNPAHTITFPTSWINLSGVNADSSKVNYIEISLINGTINYSIAKYNIPDVTAPTLLKASFLLESMNTIELLYSEVIDASVVTNTAWYTVAGKTVTAVTILGNKVRVVVNTAFAETDNPLVTFTNQVVGNGIQDASGNKAPNFSQNIGLIVYRFDSFDRANSTTSINSPSDGVSNWVTPFGAVWGIDTNKAYCFGANTTTNQANAVYLESGESNVTVRMKLTYGVTGSASTSILLNYVDSNNYFLIQFGKLNSNLQYSVLKVSGGTLSTVISATNFATWVSGTEYTFMVKNNKGVITLYNGTTSLVQITDTSLSGTKHGLRIYSGSGSTGNTDRFNDFGVYYG